MDLSTRKAVFSVLVSVALVFFVPAGTAGAEGPVTGGIGVPETALDNGGSPLPGDSLNPPFGGLLQPLIPDPGPLLPAPQPQAASTPSNPGETGGSAPAARVVLSPPVKHAPPRLARRGHTQSQVSGRADRSSKRSLAHRPAALDSSLNVGTLDSRRPAARRVADGGAAPHRSLVEVVINRIPPEYRAALIALACLATFFALVSLRERRRSRRAQRQALVDSLTDLPNRQAFERRLASEWNRSDRYGRPLGLLMLDLDDFKQVNDIQGHAAGDAVLREVAAAVSNRIRVTDMAARFGGDEFVVICPETKTAGLESLASSLERRLHEASIRTSVGFAERESTDEGPADMVARADAAMYRRKRTTRQRPKHPIAVLDSAPWLAGSSRLSRP